MSKMNARKLIRTQQMSIATQALSEWSKKHKTNQLPDMVLHVLNLMVEQGKLSTVAATVLWIEGVITRHDGMEKVMRKFVKNMEAEDDKERAKRRAGATKRFTKKKK